MGWGELAAIAATTAASMYASNKAAKAQTTAAAGAAGLSEAQYKQTREDLAPGRALYGSAARELGSLYFGGPGDNAMAGPTIDQQGNPVNAMAAMGQGGDNTVAHMTDGEMVIPKSMQTPDVMSRVNGMMRQRGTDPSEYIVGTPQAQATANPYTGAQQFPEPGMGGKAEGGGYGGGGGGGGGGGDPGFSATDMFEHPLGPLGYGIQQAGRHLASPNPDGSYGYTDPEGYSRQDGGDPRMGGGGYGAQYGNGMAGSVDANGNPIPGGYDSQQNAMARFYESPDYRINFDEGAKALEQSAAARGGLFSGNTGTALTRYGQDYGNRLYNQYANRLSSMAGMGQVAASQTGQFGAGAAGQQGNAMLAGGAAKAGGWANLSNAIQSGAQNYATYAGVQ